MKVGSSFTSILLKPEARPRREKAFQVGSSAKFHRTKMQESVNGNVAETC